MSLMHMLSIGAGLIIVFVLAYFILRQKKKVLNEQKKGIQLIVQVKELVTNLQKHRGWCSAYLRGDHSVILDIQNLQKEIKRISMQLEHQNNVNKFERWFGYSEHWSRLSKATLTLSSENSFKQHTQLIGNMLYLLEDIAESHFLTADVLREFPSISLLWRELLQVAECVGQSRALGTGVATVKVCSRVEKIRLGFLRQKITETAEVTYAQLKDHNLITANAQLDKLVEHASKQTRYLCSVIEHELVDCDVIKLDAKAYFALATEAMGSLNQIFDSKLKELESHLNKNA
ncbi:nitrate- and nitrite sensing domain-containing protein [Catenovulum sediminis]|uniref:nitrate- and nitrite sensing domain-containing protein n=1 Tax=Catenovulum sediminis TaxID=1740262 RepID=UPI00117C1A40|nr:nitrate- and nitrite sensing domain-containing protein [Catenovulum sediminis]